MLSNYAKEKMGFSKIESSQRFEAAFHLVRVYEVQGFTMRDTKEVLTRNSLPGVINFAIAIGNSINELCRDLLNDDLVEDEHRWRKESKSSPPYVLIHIGPTKYFSCSEGYRQEKDGKLLTYDSFADARAEIKSREDELLPSLLTALSVKFSAPKLVAFKPVLREVFGITKSGETVLDIRFQANASVYTSYPLGFSEAEALVAESLELFDRLNQRVAQFFFLGMNENDSVKRFLYFFLSVEILTHKSFKAIEHFQHMNQTAKVPTRIERTGLDFFTAQQKSLKNLVDRFIWCSICVWENITDEDIAGFRKLKRFRDDIAHGNVTTLPHDAAVSAQKLALKLLEN